MKHDFADIELAFEFVSSQMQEANNAILNRQTGHIHYIGDGIDDEEVPDDIDDNEKYIYIPHKNELNLGTSLVFKYIRENIPDGIDDVSHIFNYKGAYSRYKDWLEKKDKLEQWYKYEEEAKINKLKEWCKENNIEI